MEDEQLWKSARDVLADDANPLRQLAAPFISSFRVDIILLPSQPLSFLLIFIIPWVLLKGSELLRELLVKLRRDTVIIRDELRPNIVPKHSRNPIGQ